MTIIVTALTLLTPQLTQPTHGARILLYPFAHCENSHLLNMEKLVPVLQHDGHDVTMLVPDTYVAPSSSGSGGGDDTFQKVHVTTTLYQRPPTK